MNLGIRRPERRRNLHPVIDGAILRFVSGIGFSDLSDVELLSIAEAASDEMHLADPTLVSFREYVTSELRSRKSYYEIYLRNRFESQLSKQSANIFGFAEFTRSPSEYPLSTQLCIEWLQRFVDLPTEIERDMVECIFYSPRFEGSATAEALRAIVEQRLAKGYQGTQQPTDRRYNEGKNLVAVTQFRPDKGMQPEDWDCYWTALLCVLDSMSKRGSHLFPARPKANGGSL